MFGMVIETGPKYYMVPFPTQNVTDSEFLYKSFVINVLQFQFFCKAFNGFYLWVMIEPCLKFYAVPSQSQCMTLRSQTLIFFVLIFKVSVVAKPLIDLNHVWYEWI